MYRAFQAEFQVPEVKDGVPFAGRTDRAIVRDLFALHAIADSPSNRDRFVASYLGHLPACLSERQGKVLPGVSELLEQLRARTDVVVGLLTGNLRNGARTKLGHFGLFHHFAFGGFGDHQMDRNDVAREALGEVRKHVAVQVSVEQIWVIGDTPLDVLCARSIGARVLAVATGLHTMDELSPERPDILLANLTDASSLFDQFASLL
ncbi:MAG: haloacid dehalogenase-like hydrolase, partial [Planctomycetes bacterium]|nr:haloacid dehalogenase-like hydrolase [Planctomycetota bacterium]